MGAEDTSTITFNHVQSSPEADFALTRSGVRTGGRHTFTDYLSLYRFPDGWRIVSKTFQAHPGN